MNAKQLIANAEQRLMTEKHKTLKEATAAELHNAISGAAMAFPPPQGRLSFHGVSGGPPGLQQSVLYGPVG